MWYISPGALSSPVILTAKLNRLDCSRVLHRPGIRKNLNSESMAAVSEGGKMLKTTMTWILMSLILCSLALGQQRKRIQTPTPMQPASEACAFNFATGTGHGHTQYCVTANGNIAEFAATGDSGLLFEMLNGLGPASEGYGLCNIDSLTSYWDYAKGDSGNWSVSTAVSGANSVLITRTTSDGAWKLQQRISLLPGSSESYGAARIQMAVTNLTNSDHIVVLMRHANVDASGSSFNDFDTSATTAFGTALGGLGGMVSSASFLNYQFDFHFSLVQTNPDGPDPCKPFGDSGGQLGYFQGDGSVLQYFNLDLPPGRTKVVTVTYKPI